MIRYEISLDSPVPFVAITIGEHVKLIKNPALTAYTPFWLQQIMANDALRRVVQVPPRKTPMRIATVIPIEALRESREARRTASTDVGR